MMGDDAHPSLEMNMRILKTFGLLAGLGIAATAFAHEGGDGGFGHVDYALAFGFPLAVIFIISYFRTKRSQERMAVIRLMVERGQPIPPELLAGGDADMLSGGGGYGRYGSGRRGLVLIAIGGALCFCLWMTEGSAWVWGLMPLSIGVAILLGSLLENRRPQ
jgi:hypothetical protein